jgi:hypothetical protein
LKKLREDRITTLDETSGWGRVSSQSIDAMKIGIVDHRVVDLTGVSLKSWFSSSRRPNAILAARRMALRLIWANYAPSMDMFVTAVRATNKQADCQSPAVVAHRQLNNDANRRWKGFRRSQHVRTIWQNLESFLLKAGSA